MNRSQTGSQYPRRGAPRARQGGITLVVGLIMLMLLTVVVTLGFRNTTMATRMSGNSTDRNMSFQSSENAGKNAITAINLNQFNAAATPGHFAIPSATPGHFETPLARGGDTAYWTQGEGTRLAVLPAVATVADCTNNLVSAAAGVPPVEATFSWASCSVPVGYTASSNTGNAATNNTVDVPVNAQYVIEVLSTSDPNPPTVPPTYVFFYRITTRSTGGSGNADVVLQTVYSRQAAAP